MKRTLIMLFCLVVIGGSAYSANQVKPAWWHRPPPPVGKPAPPVAAGTVANVSATSIDVQTAAGVKTFAVDAKTKVVVAGTKTTIADVKVGSPVRVRFRPASNPLTAAVVEVPKPSVKGKITAIGTNSFTVQNKNGSFTVNVTDATKIFSHGGKGYQGSFADLRVGYGADAGGALSGAVLAADWVDFSPALAKGAVTAKDANTITIKTVRQATLVLAPSAKTFVLIRPRVGPNKVGTLNDVTVGAPVNVGFAPDKSGTSALLWIEVLTGM